MHFVHDYMGYVKVNFNGVIIPWWDLKRETLPTNIKIHYKYHLPHMWIRICDWSLWWEWQYNGFMEHFLLWRIT